MKTKYSLFDWDAENSKPTDAPKPVLYAYPEIDQDIEDELTMYNGHPVSKKTIKTLKTNHRHFILR